MTAPGKGSRWGAFLSSAFEGVENRLDNLLDEDQQAAQGYEQQQGMKAAPAPSPSPSPKPTASGKPLFSPKPCSGAGRTVAC